MTVRSLTLWLAVLVPAIALADDSVSTSALLNQALDSPIPNMAVRGGVMEVMKTVEAQSGVRIEADPTVWDDLPWGSDTNLSCRFVNATLRRALDVIARRLGLTYAVGREAIEFAPSPPLSRLGRRATIEELRVLDQLSYLPFGPVGVEGDVPVGNVLATVNRDLRGAGLPFVTVNRAFDAFGLSRPIEIPGNASLIGALEEISRQTDATWYPWGRSLVVVKKIDSVRVLLGKRVNRDYQNTDIAQVLMDLSQLCGVPFNFAPGVLQQVPPAFRKVTLKLEDATVDQTLAILSGATGLQFTPSERGVDVTFTPQR